jgi:hypothetical protein
MNAQELRTIDGSQIMEVKAYLAHLKASELNLRNSISNSNRLEHLLNDVQSAIYIHSNEVKTYGVNPPVSLFANSSLLSTIQSQTIAKDAIEIVTITINQSSDLNRPIDLSVFSNFPNLKYIYILSNIETTGNVISTLIRNNTANFNVFYKIDKGA